MHWCIYFWTLHYSFIRDFCGKWTFRGPYALPENISKREAAGKSYYAYKKLSIRKYLVKKRLYLTRFCGAMWFGLAMGWQGLMMWMIDPLVIIQYDYLSTAAPCVFDQSRSQCIKHKSVELHLCKQKGCADKYWIISLELRSKQRWFNLFGQYLLRKDMAEASNLQNVITRNIFNRIKTYKPPKAGDQTYHVISVSVGRYLILRMWPVLRFFFLLWFLIIDKSNIT